MDNQNYQMPRMTGTAATRTLRTSGYAGMIIGMTGDPKGCPKRREFEASGLNECIDKDSEGISVVMQLLRGMALSTERASMRPRLHMPHSDFPESNAAV